MQFSNNKCDPFFHCSRNLTSDMKKNGKQNTLPIQFFLHECEFSETIRNGIYTDFLGEIPSFLKACGLVMPLTIIAREHICLHMYKLVYLCLPMPKA